MNKSTKAQSLCGGLLNLPARRFLHPNKNKTLLTSPTTNPLFFVRKFRSTSTDSKKSTRWPPSVVSSSSSASKLPVANSKNFLSISSSHDERVDQCNTLLCNTFIIRSFSSVRDDFSSPGEKSPVCVLREDEKTWEDMPQRDAVVSVSGHAVDSEFAYPWTRDHTSCSGTGLILSGRRVLTTAHSVDNHTFLEVRNYDYPKSYTATMLAIAPEHDLAILTVDDDEFWEGLKPVEFGDTPSPGDKVIVDYFREDRDSLLLMTAHVLRLGMTRYSFWGTELLAFQVNVGSEGATSSGPAFDERGKCVGLKLKSKGNKSDFIPTEVIKHFIQDYDKNGAYTGLPLLGIKWQEMENTYLRAFMKMEHDQQGILITEVKRNYPETVILKPYDVILSIDGININNDGTVPFLRGRRIEFSYLISKKYKGDKVVIKVRRGSEICEFITELATNKQFVPANIIGRPVRYYIIGGLAFTTLSFPYIPFMRYGVETPDEDELFSQALYEEHVVLCEVLEDDINYKYAYLVENQVLVTFNNKPVEGLKSLVSMVETCNEDFMKFTFRNHKILVLPTNIARSRTPDILKAHSVSCAMSDDLKELVKLT